MHEYFVSVTAKYCKDPPPPPIEDGEVFVLSAGIIFNNICPGHNSTEEILDSLKCGTVEVSSSLTNTTDSTTNIATFEEIYSLSGVGLESGSMMIAHLTFSRPLNESMVEITSVSRSVIMIYLSYLTCKLLPQTCFSRQLQLRLATFQTS